MKRPALFSSLAVVCIVAWTAQASSEEYTGPHWASNSARLLPARRVEVGLFSLSSWSPFKGLELALHPAFIFLSPMVQAKVQLADGSGTPSHTLFASRHRVLYATQPLSLLSGTGSLALLPDDVHIPIAVQLENDFLVSQPVGDQTWTFQGGIVVAPREKSDMPLLDFPFLYQRFAAVSGPLLVRTGMELDGRIHGPFIYRADFLYSLFPLDPGHGLDVGWALEAGAQVGLDLHDRHRIVIAARMSVAEYPAGLQAHWFPSLDYRIRLFD